MGISWNWSDPRFTPNFFVPIFKRLPSRLEHKSLGSQGNWGTTDLGFQYWLEYKILGTQPSWNTKFLEPNLIRFQMTWKSFKNWNTSTLEFQDSWNTTKLEYQFFGTQFSWVPTDLEVV